MLSMLKNLYFTATQSQEPYFLMDKKPGKNHISLVQWDRLERSNIFQ